MSYKKSVVHATFLLSLFLIFFLLLITISGWTNPQDDLFPLTLIDDSGIEVTLPKSRKESSQRLPVIPKLFSPWD